jgi:type II secretory pathway pseudopilin PulG
MMMQKEFTHSARGSALIYILIAVALLAALTVSLMEPSSQQAQSQNTSNLVTNIDAQATFVVSAVQECTLTYPDQDSELTTTEQENTPYPINPEDPYFDAQSSAIASAADNAVSGIRCPGNPGGDGATNQDHALIFGGSSGKFLPPPPPLFDAWEYYNGADGVFFFTKTNKTDAFIQTSLQRLDDAYAECEADVNDQLSGAAVNLSSDITPGDGAERSCPAGYICFRYWIIQKASAVATDAGCP